MNYRAMSDSELEFHAGQGDSAAAAELRRRYPEENSATIGGLVYAFIFAIVFTIWWAVLKSFPRPLQPVFGFGNLILIGWWFSRKAKNKGCLVIAIIFTAYAYIGYIFAPRYPLTPVRGHWNGKKAAPVALAKIPWAHVENSRAQIEGFLFVPDQYRQRPRAKDEAQWQHILHSMKAFSDSHHVKQLIATKYVDDDEVQGAKARLEEAATASNVSDQFSPEVMKRIHSQNSEAYQIALDGYVCWKEGWRP